MTYTEIAQRTENEHLKKVYEIIARDAGENNDLVAHSVPNMVKDGVLKDTPRIGAISHTIDSVNEIRDSLYQYQQSLLPAEHKSVNIDDFCKNVAKRAFNFVVMKYQYKNRVYDSPEGGTAIDSWYNSFNGIGTSSDPGFYNTADIPLQMSPQQVTAYYGSGGIAKVIIDKKTNGPFINGYSFDGDFTRKQLDDFKAHYERLGLTTALKHGLRDSLLFGGSAIIPHFIQDNNKLNYSKPITMMGQLGKKEIDRFWVADRWNLVLVPDTNIEAADYFYPPFFYCPIAGVEISTDRMAIIRINELPFWGAIVQTGWAVSDLESWMKSVLSYNITISAIPVMAQQISLVYQHIPADPIIFANGPEMFEQWAQANNSKLKLWSSGNPQTFNSYGEVKSLDRQYNGYDELVRLLRENIGAESTIPESSIFHTQSKGFSDGIEDVTLKQSEAFKNISNIFCEQVQPLIYVLGLDYFGKKNESKVRTLRLCLDSNTIITNDQKASIGMNFFNMLQVGMSQGLRADSVAKVAKKFISGVNIDDDIIKILSEAQDVSDKKEEKDRKAQSNKSLFGFGNKGSGKPGSATPPKSSLTPGSKNDQKKMGRLASGKGKS